MTDPARLDFLDRVAREHDRWEREVKSSLHDDFTSAATYRDFAEWSTDLLADGAQVEKLARRIGPYPAA